METLPFYRLSISEDDETGVYANALVDVPAHMKNFVAFKNEEKKVYHFDDDEKRMVLGVMMSAGTPIYRNAIAELEIPEHYAFFTAEDIEKIRKKFHRQQLGRVVNEMHDPEKMVAGVTMIDSYIIGGDKNPKAPEVFSSLNLQDGSWIAQYYIENDEVWAKVKSGEFKGFSVEGLFDIIPASLKKKFKAAKGKFSTIQEVTKWDIEINEDNIEEGVQLTQTYDHGDGDPLIQKVGSGKYIIEDGRRILVDSDGIVRTIFNKQNKMKKKSLIERLFGKTEDPKGQVFAEATTVDGTVLFYEGDLAEGTALFVEVDGEQQPAPEGPHQVDVDGMAMIITLDENGVISSVEEAPEGMPEEMSAEVIEEIVEKLRKEYEEKIDAIKSEYEQVFAAQAAQIKHIQDFHKNKFNHEPLTGKNATTAGYKKFL